MGGNKSDSIVFVFASSNSYIIQTYVTAFSVLRNCNTHIEMHFLISEECREEVDRLFLTLESKKTKCIIHRINKAYFSEAFLGKQHVLTTTYYRLLIPYIVSEIERCVYLDSDIIVNKDISELNNWNMGNNIVGGVLAAGYQNIRHDSIEYSRLIKIPDLSHYINAGVLLLRPNRILDEGIYDRWIQLSKKEYPVLDQDIINISCYGKIELLPPIYNSMTTHQFYELKDLERVYGIDDANLARTNPSIIHYTGREKPWNTHSVPFRNIWWLYYQQVTQRSLVKDLFVALDLSLSI